METDFFKMFDRALDAWPYLHLSVGYTKVADWVLVVEDRLNGGKEQILLEQHCDRKVVFAAAYTKLCEYLSDVHGGY